MKKRGHVAPLSGPSVTELVTSVTRGSLGLGRSHVYQKKWQYLTATRQGVARYSLMKYTSLRNK